MSKKTITDQDRIKQVGSFLNLGFKDYLASRVLLNSGLVLQGAICASTCVEKYFKAIIAFRGNEVKGHLKDSHFRSVKNFDASLYNSLNESFLLFLEKVYPLRYADTLQVGFSIMIPDRPTLAELDYTVAKLERSFKFIDEHGNESQRRYFQAVMERDERLYLNNYVLNNLDKEAFIAEEELVVYEMRYRHNGQILEVEYAAQPSPHDGNFMKEALIEKNK